MSKFGIFVLSVAVSSGGWSDEFEAALIVDWVENLEGGVEQSSEQLAVLDLSYGFSTNIGANKQGTLFINALVITGGQPTSMVGDAQGTSNIEAADNAGVYQLWYRHELSEKLALTLGLHDYNAVFYALDSACGLINSSFGIGIDTAQVGPSIYPTTAMGMITTYEHSDVYVYAGIYDGIPGDPNHERGTHIRFDSGDGLFYSLETGWQNTSEHPWKLGFGGWYHTAEQQNPVDDNLSKANFGIYTIGEYRLRERWQAFFQLGYADPAKNHIGQYLGAGLRMEGLFVESDTASLGVATAFVSHDYRSGFPEAEASETALEASYQFQALQWLMLQPDLQYVVNPGFDPELDNALVFTLRLEATFP